MAQDPAFLFYPNDYMGGTMGMSFEAKGAYMHLLILQFNNGPFTLEQARIELNGSFDRIWAAIWKKFIEEDGKFFNKRLQEEKEKRMAFTDSRRKNLKKKEDKPHMVPHMEPHMENRNENRNRDEDDNQKGGTGENTEMLVPKMMTVWKESNPDYPVSYDEDYPALKGIAHFICRQEKIKYQPTEPPVVEKILQAWGILSNWIAQDSFHKTFSLKSINRNIQTISQKVRHESTNPKAGKAGASKVTGAQLNQALAKFRNQGQSVANTG